MREMTQEGNAGFENEFFAESLKFLSFRTIADDEAAEVLRRYFSKCPYEVGNTFSVNKPSDEENANGILYFLLLRDFILWERMFHFVSSIDKGSIFFREGFYESNGRAGVGDDVISLTQYKSAYGLIVPFPEESLHCSVKLCKVRSMLYMNPWNVLFSRIALCHETGKEESCSGNYHVIFLVFDSVPTFPEVPFPEFWKGIIWNEFKSGETKDLYSVIWNFFFWRVFR